MEQLQYNLLFRWFVGLSMDDPVWHPTTFTKNRERLLAGDVAARFGHMTTGHCCSVARRRPIPAMGPDTTGSAAVFGV